MVFGYYLVLSHSPAGQSIDIHLNPIEREALEILINYAFFTLEIDHLHARIRKNNLFSIRLFNSCGFALQSERLGFQYFIKLAQK